MAKALKTKEKNAGQGPAFPLPFLEPFRAFSELATQPLGAMLLRYAPKGDGHSVLTLPGFLTGDRSTSLIRRHLRARNYEAYPWNLGRNNGPQTSGEGGVDLDRRIEEIFQSSGRKVSLVGWSLGGVMARNAARRIPHMVRQVITLGSPFDAHLNVSSIGRLFELVSGHDPNDPAFMEVLNYNRPPPPPEVPTTSIFSKSDGVVHWTSCIERPGPNTDNIEVYGSHIGLGVNPIVYYLLAERLSIPVEDWSPFDRMTPSWRQMVYPSSGHGYDL